MQRQFIEIIVGLFVIAGVVALLFLSLKVSNLNSVAVTDPYQVNARFDNIGSLKVRAPVTMAGVKIGRVNEIRLDSASYQAEVVMDISGEYKNLPVDSSASINTQGLLGEQFVSLEPGGQQEYLANGDHIRLTQSAVVLENLIGELLFSNSQGAKQ
ncbi:MAG: outer membrane lipid asymmetry maintenance protein MlaD [Arenicellales bacterium]|jgi:phospholipid/cholesterol/gamma-HCH transport system substrate-binding protein